MNGGPIFGFWVEIKNPFMLGDRIANHHASNKADHRMSVAHPDAS
ncbi:hypothetical protein MESS2_770021 [Mesorhizobium metallidurans STM 2683]|uniref:Uncharacterized protein n=1 Tax=Mesorhizobium metallidurans STM 2683 TaxID=1297569 RepID=M5F9Q2_9HYPH|nr:hypothetical protein MESS2_770021 [Mesorhizobium metallidurans STM 2683]